MRATMIACLLLGCGQMYDRPGQGQQTPQQTSQQTSQPQGPPGGGEATDPSTAQDPPNPGNPTAVAPVPPAPPAPAGQALSAEAAGYVAAHNKVRAQHCAGALTWSPKLASVAQAWANSLRDRGCKFEHSQNNAYGENLAGGTIGMLDPNATVAMWYEELKDYNFASGGFSMQSGHFTQVVWRGTTQLGCGRSQCNGSDIIVCEYDPPGNFEGEYAKNVLPVGCK